MYFTDIRPVKARLKALLQTLDMLSMTEGSLQKNDL